MKEIILFSVLTVALCLCIRVHPKESGSWRIDEYGNWNRDKVAGYLCTSKNTDENQSCSILYEKLTVHESQWAKILRGDKEIDKSQIETVFIAGFSSKKGYDTDYIGNWYCHCVEGVVKSYSDINALFMVAVILSVDNYCNHLFEPLPEDVQCELYEITENILEEHPELRKCYREQF